MKTTSGPFHSLVGSVLESTHVGRLLADRRAIVLERIARGGGATRWFFCQDPRALSEISCELLPGSVVSFYFDDRIREVNVATISFSDVESFIRRDGDAVVGVLEGKIHIRVEFPAGPDDLQEFLSSIATGTKGILGPFPGREDDGIDAVTITLPDADGVARRHPH